MCDNVVQQQMTQEEAEHFREALRRPASTVDATPLPVRVTPDSIKGGQLWAQDSFPNNARLVAVVPGAGGDFALVSDPRAHGSMLCAEDDGKWIYTAHQLAAHFSKFRYSCKGQFCESAWHDRAATKREGTMENAKEPLEDAGGVPVHAVVPGRVGEDLKALAGNLGYAWPDDEEGQWRVLKLMAIMAAHWRNEYEASCHEAWREIQSERLYRQQQQRYARTVKKLQNTRKALREFMASQVAYVREAMAEISSSR